MKIKIDVDNQMIVDKEQYINKDKLLNSYFMRIFKALDKIELIYNLEYEGEIIDTIKEIERILRGYENRF